MSINNPTLSKTTVYVCANWKYEHYIPLFAHSTLFHNSDVVVEVGVDNTQIIESPAIKFISEKYGDRFNIHLVDWNHVNLNETIYPICPNIVRFITEPRIKNDYIYFCNVDMLNLEQNITKINTDIMEQNELNYNNWIRPNKERMTGLHFAKWDSYYPLELDIVEELAKQGLMGHDENFLYAYVNRKNIISETKFFIPQHGIHLTPNRAEIEISKKWMTEWYEYRNSEEFLILEKYLSKDLERYITLVDLNFWPTLKPGGTQKKHSKMNVSE